MRSLSLISALPAAMIPSATLLPSLSSKTKRPAP